MGALKTATLGIIFLVHALRPVFSIESDQGNAQDNRPPVRTVSTDFYGDPLPPGAIARFGTIYLRTDFHELAFRADGREFYSWKLDGLLRVYDAATGKVLRAFQFPAPLSGSILLWEVPAPSPVKLASVSDAFLERAWKALGDAEPGRAFAAVADLADHPDAAVAFLKRRLRPVGPISGEQLRRLIVALVAPAFQTRQAAERNLGALGPQVWPSLRKALAQRPSPEAKAPLERLLEGESRPPSAEVLRHHRALRALEWAGTPEARGFLAELGSGGPSAPWTQEANAAVRRLDQKQRKK
jgi:hypothetical protein